VVGAEWCNMGEHDRKRFGKRWRSAECLQSHG